MELQRNYLRYLAMRKHRGCNEHDCIRMRSYCAQIFRDTFQCLGNGTVTVCIRATLLYPDLLYMVGFAGRDISACPPLWMDLPVRWVRLACKE